MYTFCVTNPYSRQHIFGAQCQHGVGTLNLKLINVLFIFPLRLMKCFMPFIFLYHTSVNEDEYSQPIAFTFVRHSLKELQLCLGQE